MAGRSPRPLDAAATLVVAGLSARYLAESARQAGWRVIALDLFGDVDTRRVADVWRPIGRADTLAIDAGLLRAALAEAAHEPGVIGWIAGSGFEVDLGLLDAGGDRLPRLGLPSDDIAAVRDPCRFFALLDRLGLAHPEVAWALPQRPAGWLHKRAGGSGGAHIRPAGLPGALFADSYFQRHQPGTPMSALCLADGASARLVALNRQTVMAASPGCPHLFAGVCGPVGAPALQARVETALALLVPALALRGLLSLDFIEVDGEPFWLEINPRPSASMQLHAEVWPGGLLAAHVQALSGQLPGTAAHHPPGWRGVEHLFAESPGRVDAALARVLADQPFVHDLPAAGAHFEAGQPVCSVSAEAADQPGLRALLDRRLSAVRHALAPLEQAPFPEETTP